MQEYKKYLYNEELTGFCKYLESIHFRSKLKTLAKKFKNKKILIYGNGTLFTSIVRDYALKDSLNIVAISDMKYETDNVTEYMGFLTVKPSEISNVNLDVILIATVNPVQIKKFLLNNNYVKKGIIIEPVIQNSLTDKINKFTKKFLLSFDYLRNSKNIFKTVKYLLFLTESEIETKINYLKVINDLRNTPRKKIRVAFLCEENAKWGYQSIYDEMISDNNFEVLPIINLPIITNRRQEFLQNENIKFFNSFGMEAIDGYDYENNLYKCLKDFEPNIVFYQQPWFIAQSQLPQNVSKYALTCIVSYGLTSINANSWGSDSVRNVSGHMWKMFAESDYHNKFYQKAAKLRYKDILQTTGYPKLDYYKLPTDSRFNSLWKNSVSNNPKRIIWAPHHTIDNYGLNMSNFKSHYLYFLNFAKNHPEYSFVFKPHPGLKNKCISEKFLSEEEYNNYINDWNSLDNSIVYNGGNYFDIFKTSDVLITDCSSFLAEYFYSGKPIVFLNNPNRARFNKFGQKIKKGFYTVNKIEDLDNLLYKLLVENQDWKKSLREDIIKKEFFCPKDGAGKSVVDFIKKELNRC